MHLSGLFGPIVAGFVAANAGQPAVPVNQVNLGDLTVVVENLRSDQGQVFLALWQDPDGFTDPDAAMSKRKAVPRGNVARVTFPDLKPGRYALASYHDENDNGKLDQTWIGWPEEGIGFSNGAWISLGPPSFRAAAVEVAPGTQAIVISLRY